MRNFVKFAMVMFLSVVVSSCTLPDDTDNTQGYLDVTYNNIAGVWRMESYESGVELQEEVGYYIEFNRAERTFTTYDTTNTSMGAYKRTGEYDIVVDTFAVISGKFDNGLGFWKHSYYVRDLTAERMVWIATDDDTIEQVYVRAKLPEWRADK